MTLAAPDAQRQAELAVLSKTRPPTIEKCVHLRLGPVEVIEKRPDRWAFRQPPNEFVEDREPTEFRPFMTRAEASRHLAALGAPEPLHSSEEERRAWLKKFKLNKVDRRKPARVVRELRYFYGLLAAGLRLGSLERAPFLVLRTEFVVELAEVLGETVATIEARLPTEFTR